MCESQGTPCPPAHGGRDARQPMRLRSFSLPRSFQLPSLHRFCSSCSDLFISDMHAHSQAGHMRCDILENGGLRTEVGSGTPEASGLLSLFLVSLSVKWVEY